MQKETYVRAVWLIQATTNTPLFLSSPSKNYKQAKNPAEKERPYLKHNIRVDRTIKKKIQYTTNTYPLKRQPELHKIRRPKLINILSVGQF